MIYISGKIPFIFIFLFNYTCDTVIYLTFYSVLDAPLLNNGYITL